MAAIFVSHSNCDNDNAHASRLNDELERAGYRSVFLDFDRQSGIRLGANWEQQLYKQVRACQVMIAVISPDSLRSVWCAVEISQARALRKPILPVLVRGTELGQLADLQAFRAQSSEECSTTYPALLAALEQASVSKSWLRPNQHPYPGLPAFDEGDEGIFVGREREITEVTGRLSDAVSAAHWLVLLGASGSGKSSLLRAGVVPKLRRDPRWIVVGPLRRGKDPRDSFALALAAASELANAPKPVAELRSVVDDVDPAGLLNIARELRLASKRSTATLLVVIDQFEEWLLDTTELAEPLGDILSLLRAVSDQPDGAFAVLVTMRADFLGAFQSAPALRGITSDEIVVKPLAATHLPRVICEPAALGGVYVEPELVSELIRDTLGPNGLPLLAFALRELYSDGAGSGELTLHDYRTKLGGLGQAIAARADDVLQTIERAGGDRADLRRAFLSLVQITEDRRSVRRPVRWNEFSESLRGLLIKFVDARLLVLDQDGDHALLDVAHEALFQSWPTLTRWVAESRSFLSWRRQLDPLVAAWEERGTADSLLHLPQLSEAESWLHREPTLISERERKYVSESLAAAHRRTMLQRTGVAAAFIVLAVFAAFAAWMAKRAESALALEAIQAKRATQAAADEVEQRRRAEASARQAREAEIVVAKQRERAVTFAVDMFNRTAYLDYDSSTVSPKSIETIREILRQLREMGMVERRMSLTGHVGLYCTEGRDGRALSDKDPASRCRLMSEEYALAIGDRRARAFRQLAQTEGFKNLEVSSMGVEVEFVPYPRRGTVGEWNEAARQNDRVVLRLR